VLMGMLNSQLEGMYRLTVIYNHRSLIFDSFYYSNTLMIENDLFKLRNANCCMFASVSASSTISTLIISSITSSSVTTPAYEP
jgi:hypothetical protein